MEKCCIRIGISLKEKSSFYYILLSLEAITRSKTNTMILYLFQIKASAHHNQTFQIKNRSNITV